MTTIALDDDQKRFSPSPYVVAGYLTIAVAFGIFGTWAATAPLASGVVASGTVSVESNRKAIQHFEGGIVQELLVQEGDIVDAGQPLVILDPTQAQGNYSVLNTRLTLLQATEARLVAESTNADTITFPEHLQAPEDRNVEIALELQRTLFHDRKATKEGQIGILQSRIDQLHNEIDGLEVQLKATEQQRDSLALELERLTKGQESGVVATNQLAQMSRQQWELQGNYGQIVAQIAKSRQSIAETELQIVQISQEFKERAGSELRDLRDQLNEVSERVVLARDVLSRTVIESPVRGMVQEMQIHTTGGVVRPADHILDIIPLDDDLIIHVRVRPIDIDSVAIGSVAEVRFAAFNSNTTPVIFGTVDVLSQDVIQPEDGRSEPYYVARVHVDDKDVPTQIRGRLVAGMPADIIIATGERTLMEYLLKPLEDRFSKGMREK